MCSFPASNYMVSTVFFTYYDIKKMGILMGIFIDKNQHF